VGICGVCKNINNNNNNSHPITFTNNMKRTKRFDNDGNMALDLGELFDGLDSVGTRMSERQRRAFKKHVKEMKEESQIKIKRRKRRRRRS
jgi:hypothetical protein